MLINALYLPKTRSFSYWLIFISSIQTIHKSLQFLMLFKISKAKKIIIWKMLVYSVSSSQFLGFLGSLYFKKLNKILYLKMRNIGGIWLRFGFNMFFPCFIDAFDTHAQTVFLLFRVVVRGDFVVNGVIFGHRKIGSTM